MTAATKPQHARRFDWDEARRLYESGTPVREIARLLGVGRTAIRRATSEAHRVRDEAYGKVSKAAIAGACPWCGALFKRSAIAVHRSRAVRGLAPMEHLCKTCAAKRRRKGGKAVAS